MSALKVPYLQVCPLDRLAIFKLADLPLARVSIFCVLDVTEKGPKEELDAVSDG